MTIKGWRTLAWNVINAVVPVMQMAESAYQIPTAWMPYWIGVFIVGNIVLRMNTTGPVGTGE